MSTLRVRQDPSSFPLAQPKQAGSELGGGA
jgi:hypothetical protein